MLTNPSQVIIRNSDLIKQHSILVINYESDLLPQHLLEHASKVEALALDYHHHLMMVPHKSERLHLHFGHTLPHSECFDTVIVYFPKAKNLAPYLLTLAAHHLSPQGQLLVVGEKKGGIKSLDKLLPSNFEPCYKIDNARHCMLYSSELIERAKPICLENWCTSYPLDTPQGRIEVCNLVGVFSEKRIDAGTELMLSHLPELSGRVLDFGCGAGVIAAALLKGQPELTLECIDINAMALASCALTLERNNMQAKVYPSDGLQQTSGYFNAIVSNPPFHDGLVSTTNITTQFVKDSKQKLAPEGTWQIVANRHLPYSDAIAQHFDGINVVAENNKYKVYKNQR